MYTFLFCIRSSLQSNETANEFPTRRDDSNLSIDLDTNITPEDFITVWLDSNVHQYKHTQNELHQTSNSLEVFESENDCHHFLTTMCKLASKKLFLIVSGNLGETFVPVIHDLKQIIFIYVFCQHYEKHSIWASSYVKIGNDRVVIQAQDLFCQITKDIRYTLETTLPINVFRQEKEQSIQDLDKDSASAMWFQLLIDVLINMKDKSNTKSAMICLCDLLYTNNDQVRKQIIDFKNNYRSEDAVRWYTRDSFLYRILNKALRMKNMNVIYPFGFFIADLHQQMCLLHSKFLELFCADTLTVYRGQQLSIEEIRKLEMNIGGLISINTFLSTTMNREIAVAYAGERKDESVLFEIQIDVRLNNKISFGSVAEDSQVHFEEEVLFSIGAIFRIMAVNHVGNIYHISLKISDNEDEDMKRLFDYYYSQYEIGQPTTLITLGMFLHEMGQLDQAEYYYRLMLQNSIASDNHDVMAKLHAQLGYVAKTQGHYKQAIESYNRALSLVLVNNSTTYNELFEIYNNLGIAHRYIFNLDTALEFMHKALDLQISYKERDESALCQAYNNLGQVYRGRKEYVDAEKYFQKALTVFKESNTIPANHPNLATLLSNLGNLYTEMERYDEAIAAFKDILTFQLKVLPSDHPNVGRTYNNLAYVYLNKKEHYKTALKLLKKTLSIDLKKLSPDHPWTVRVYMNIARVYYARNMYLIGWLYARKAMDRRYIFQPSEPDYVKCDEIYEMGRKGISSIISAHIIALKEIEANIV